MHFEPLNLTPIYNLSTPVNSGNQFDNRLLNVTIRFVSGLLVHYRYIKRQGRSIHNGLPILNGDEA